MPTHPLLSYSQSSGHDSRKKPAIAAGALETAAAGRAWMPVAGFAFLLALKVLYAFVLRIDSDEPQHLHVVWGWANGLLQYRDIFDNHSPLFQMICAPLFRLFGERADIIIPMRLAMIPFYAITVWAVYRVGDLLFSRNAGIWAAFLTAATPIFFHTSTEFRTDDPWVALWVLVFVVLSGGPFTLSRSLLFGFVLGVLFSVSMKTTLMVIALALAGGVTFLVGRAAGERIAFRVVAARLGAVLLGVIIIPGILVAFFAYHGALKQMYYCVIRHNTLPGLGSWDHLGLRQFWFFIDLPFLVGAAWLIFRLNTDAALSSRRALVFLGGAFYVAVLRGFWPLVTNQDFLPFAPLLCIMGTPILLYCGERLRALWNAGPWMDHAVPALVLAAEMIALTAAHPPWRNEVKDSVRYLRMALKLVHPGEYIMDGKGETIFRPRSFYYVLEGVTLARMRMGLIPDDIAESLIKTRTCVIRPNRLPQDALEFIEKNYLPIPAKLLVAGQILKESGPGGSGAFEVVIPASYGIVSSGPPVHGFLDGTPYTGPRFLDAGRHEFKASGHSGMLALFWARATEYGYTPFQKIRKPRKGSG